MYNEVGRRIEEIKVAGGLPVLQWRIRSAVCMFSPVR